MFWAACCGTYSKKLSDCVSRCVFICVQTQNKNPVFLTELHFLKYLDRSENLCFNESACFICVVFLFLVCLFGEFGFFSFQFCMNGFPRQMKIEIKVGTSK